MPPFIPASTSSGTCQGQGGGGGRVRQSEDPAGPLPQGGVGGRGSPDGRRTGSLWPYRSLRPSCSSAQLSQEDPQGGRQSCPRFLCQGLWSRVPASVCLDVGLAPDQSLSPLVSALSPLLQRRGSSLGRLGSLSCWIAVGRGAPPLSTPRVLLRECGPSFSVVVS